MRKFKTESKRLLDLMIDSVYTNHDIFLRELISNASDALDRLYARSLTDPSIARGDLGIHISFDRDRRILTVSDNGIGMDDTALDRDLGTIAHSGSLEFKDKGLESASPVAIIGRFGVGFYSAFMVADRVTVVSRTYGSDEAYRWDSNGIDGYTIDPAEREAPGTDVILHIRESTEEENLERYLDRISLQNLIKRYSDYIRYPISMEVEALRAGPGRDDDGDGDNGGGDGNDGGDDGGDDGGGAPSSGDGAVAGSEVINSMVPIWARKDDVAREEYHGFYKAGFHDVHDPLRTIPVHAEGTLEYDALLFIPRKVPENRYGGNPEKGLVLYSSHVLITDSYAELLPDHLGFVRGVVDSGDLKLNISREVLQQDHRLELIGRHLGKKVTNELYDLRDNDREEYIDFFNEFGHGFKYAIYASHGALTEELADLLLFHSAREGHPITLAEYVEAAKEAGRIAIYYATGDDIERLARTPSVRTVLDRGHDVLLCPGSMQDEFCFMTMGSYKGSDFLNVASGNLDMGDEAEKEEARQANKDNAGLLDTLLGNTPDSVSRVIASTRLKSADDAASCITTDGSVTIGMARFLLARPDRENAPQVRFILEVNIHHGLFAGLQVAFEARDDERVKDYATVLLNQAFLAEDIPIDNPFSFNAAMNALIG